MRVAYVCMDMGVPVFGCKGCSVHVREVVRALQHAGAQVDLYAARLGGSPDESWLGVRSIPLISGTHEGSEQRERAAMAMNEQLPMLLSQEKPYDLVYERYSLWSDRAMRWARQVGAPAVLEVNAPLIEEQQEHRRLHHIDQAMRVRQNAFTAADWVVTVSQAVADYVGAGGVDRRKVWVSPNGVDPNRFQNIQRYQPRASDGSFTVGFVGTLKPWHGVTELVKAFALLWERDHDVRLLIVGDGPERERVDSMIDRLGLRQVVTMTGAVSPGQIPEYLASMDVGVAPYPPGEHYFSPMKVVEYMASGLAVVASDIGQIRSVVQDKMGILCPPGDANAFAEALHQLRSHPELRRSMGQNGRAYVLSHHTWSGYIQELIERCGLGGCGLTHNSSARAS